MSKPIAYNYSKNIKKSACRIKFKSIPKVGKLNLKESETLLDMFLGSHMFL